MSFDGDSLEVNIGSLEEEEAKLRELLDRDDWYYSDSDSEESREEEEEPLSGNGEEEEFFIPQQGPWKDLCNSSSSTSAGLSPDPAAVRLSSSSTDLQSVVDFLLSKLGQYEFEDDETEEETVDSAASSERRHGDPEATPLLEMEGGSAISTPSSTLDRRKLEEEETVSRPSYYYIAKELLTSERTYVQGIRLLEKVLHGSVKTAKKSRKPILSEQYRKRIFLNIGEIHALNFDLLQELESRMNQWDSETIVADVMVRRAPFFKLYSLYTSRFEDAQIAFIEAMKTSKPFADLVHLIENSTICRGLPLSSYMLYPIQRIPRYRLLLEDYKKRLPADHADVENAKEALRCISEVAQHLNERIKDLEQQAIVVKLQKLFIGRDMIVLPGRRFLLRGPVELVSGRRLNKRKTRILILFSDMLLVNKLTRGIKLKIKQKLPLLTLQVSSMHSQVTENTFCLFTPSVSKPFRFCARNEQERDKFVRTIRIAVSNQIEKKKSFENARIITPHSLSDPLSRKTYKVMFQDPSLAQSSQSKLIRKRHRPRTMEVTSPAGNDETDSPDGGDALEMGVVMEMEEFDAMDEVSSGTADSTLSGYIKYCTDPVTDKWILYWLVLNYTAITAYSDHQMEEPVWALPLASCAVVKPEKLILKVTATPDSIHFFQFNNEYDYIRWSSVLEDFINCDYNLHISQSHSN